MTRFRKHTLTFALFVFATGAVAATGCEKNASTENPDDAAADADLDPVAKLEHYQAEIQADMDRAMAPVTETEALIAAMGEAPAKFNLDRAALMGMFKASFEDGKAEVSADLEIDAEARAELEAMLAQITALKVTFETYPETIKEISGHLVEVAGKAVVEATAASTALTAKLKNPLLKAEGKLELQGQLDAVTSIKTNIEGQLQEIKAMPQALPAKVAESSAKLTASFVAG